VNFRVDFLDKLDRLAAIDFIDCSRAESQI